MCSTVERQTTTLLAVVGGIMTHITDCYEIGPVLRAAVAHASDTAVDILVNKVKHNETPEDRAWIETRLEEWESLVEAVPVEWSMHVLSCMATIITGDLLSVVRESVAATISPLLPTVLAVDNFFDPTGRNFDMIQKADDLAHTLYQSLNFTPRCTSKLPHITK